MPYPTQVYQDEMAKLLRQLYPPPTPVRTEWRALESIAGLYSPRIDIAVGPFSVVRGRNYIQEYDGLMEDTRPFIERLRTYHCNNVDQYTVSDDETFRHVPPATFAELRTFNENARCLMAIEIENRVSRKHLLGGAVNASVLGRLAVIIGWDEMKVRALVKLREYWHFLESVGKNTFATRNLLILSPEQFGEAITATRANAG